jgi:hypothetical protein
LEGLSPGEIKELQRKDIYILTVKPQVDNPHPNLKFSINILVSPFTYEQPTACLRFEGQRPIYTNLRKEP